MGPLNTDEIRPKPRPRKNLNAALYSGLGSMGTNKRKSSKKKK